MPELAKFDPAAIAEALKDKIRAEAMNLIPEDTIKAMIVAVTDEFINGRRQPYGNEVVYDQNTLKGIVRSVVQAHITKAASEELNKPEWEAKFNNAGAQIVSDGMKKVIAENADAMLMNMVGCIAQNAVEQFRYQLEQTIRNSHA